MKVELLWNYYWYYRKSEALEIAQHFDDADVIEVSNGIDIF